MFKGTLVVLTQYVGVISLEGIPDMEDDAIISTSERISSSMIIKRIPFGHIS
jgi:hypothetical protein